MKKIFGVLVLSFVLFSCNNQLSEEDKSWIEDKIIEVHNSLEENNGQDEEEDKITQADELMNRIENGDEKVFFHGFGTEPFWDIYLTKNEVLYTLNEENELFTLLTPFNINSFEQTIKYKDSKGEFFEVTIIKESAGDGMSDMTFPYSVIWSIDTPHLNGAGKPNK